MERGRSNGAQGRSMSAPPSASTVLTSHSEGPSALISIWFIYCYVNMAARPNCLKEGLPQLVQQEW